MSEYYMFHKPRGCVTARRDERHKTVMDYFPLEKRDVLFPVGRLDKDTEGLLLVTDDGALCYRLLMPENEVSKTYFFWAQGLLTEEKCREVEGGVKIYKNRDDTTAPAKITVTGVSTMRAIKDLLCEDDSKVSNRRGDLPVTSGYITITEGKKHQVKRMIRYAGCRVVYLKRMSMGALSLDETLPAGEYRPLTEEELALLQADR